MTYAFKTMASPVGELTLVASGQGLAAILWENDDPDRVRLGDMREDAAHPVLVRTMFRLLWDLSQPDARGIARFTILLQDPSDLRRLQLAYATQNTVLNNGGVAGMAFDRWP